MVAITQHERVVKKDTRAVQQRVISRFLRAMDKKDDKWLIENKGAVDLAVKLEIKALDTEAKRELQADGFGRYHDLLLEVDRISKANPTRLRAEIVEDIIDITPRAQPSATHDTAELAPQPTAEHITDRGADDTNT